MNNSEYTVTMPYKEFEKWQEIERKFQKFQLQIKNCFIIDENKRVVDVQINDLKQIGKELLPLRYQDYNYVEVR